MEKKQQVKPTNAQLQRRLDKAILHIDRTKDTESVYFADRGLRLTANEEYAIIETGFHRHVFSNMTMQGYSRPWMYTKRIIEMANGCDCKTDNGGYSYALMLEKLNKKDDKSEYNIASYYSWFLYNIFNPLYGIAEDETSSFLVYEDYLHNIARNAIILGEKLDDITNKQFIEKVIANIREYSEGLEEHVLFHKRTDEEVLKEEIEAMQEQEIERGLNG